MIQRYAIIFLITTLVLTGCTSHVKHKPRAKQQTSGRYHQRNDSAPVTAHIPDNILHIPNAEPKEEPISKYGNPASYVVFNKRYHVLKSSSGYKSSGLASWYGTKFHGYRTSSGELYDMYAMTAAHKTLPLPTYVEVKNLDNGKKVIVKVNDRGPFHGNRILDLSYAAATKLDIVRKGTGRIQVTAINPKNLSRQRLLAKNTRSRSTFKTRPSKQNKTLALNQANAKPRLLANQVQPAYKYLQVGAFSNKENAEGLRQKILQLSGPNLKVNIHSSTHKADSVFRVRIGPIANASLLNKIKSKIIQAKLPTPIALP